MNQSTKELKTRTPTIKTGAKQIKSF